MCASTAPTAAQIRLSHQLLWQHVCRIKGVRIVQSFAVVGVRKPDPQIFQRAAETLGVSPSDAVVVGDSYTKDILPAHSIGCQTVWIKGEGWTDDEPSDCIADMIIHDLSELLVVKDKLEERING